MPLRLHPYNPDRDLKVAVFNTLWKIQLAYNRQRPDPIAVLDEAVERAKAHRRKWYYNGGGKAVCAKNGRDRRARLLREKKL